MNIKICARSGKKQDGDLRNMTTFRVSVVNYRELKLLSGIEISEKDGKVSKRTNALDVRRLLPPLKTLKRFLRRYRDERKTLGNRGKHPTPCYNVPERHSRRGVSGCLSGVANTSPQVY
ncbi:hypothetical protein TNCV_2884641 [Trichonephila clavipes]|nr:hypothetical protein TNCV_2884641 [Trichonephila clavipes]